MLLTLLKSKIHRATVTDADLSYEGSISICPSLIDSAKLCLNEKVDIYNCTNGERFSTYVILGKSNEICLDGAADRRVQKGDVVIIAAYMMIDAEKAPLHKPDVILVNGKNERVQ